MSAPSTMSPIFPEAPDARPPAWPKAVGITSIVLGGLWSACGLCGSVWYLGAPTIMKMAEQQMGPAPQVMLPSMTQTGVTILGTLVAFVLLGAGICTVRRRPAGRTLHLIYAPLEILVSLVAASLGWQQQVAIQQWAQENAADKWAQQQQGGGAAGMAMLVVFTAVALGWSVFCLIWFGPMKRRPEAGAPQRTVI